MNNKKIDFTNRGYEYGLKFILLILIVLNGYNFFVSFSIKALIPVLLNSAVLVVVMNRHKATKKIVQGWSLIFFVIAPILVLISSYFLESIEDYFSVELLLRYASIIAGLVIYVGANEYIENQKPVEVEIDDHLIT